MRLSLPVSFMRVPLALWARPQAASIPPALGHTVKPSVVQAALLRLPLSPSPDLCLPPFPPVVL